MLAQIISFFTNKISPAGNYDQQKYKFLEWVAVVDLYKFHKLQEMACVFIYKHIYQSFIIIVFLFAH